MALRYRIPAAVAYLCLLLWVNLYIARDLFFTEYTGHTNSLQGLWISIARLAGEHWFHPAWWLYQDSGEPFEHTCMPLLPGATAVYAKVGHVSAPRAFNASPLPAAIGPLSAGNGNRHRLGAGVRAAPRAFEMGFRHAEIRATARHGQVVSVQTAYHRGWHASANGRRADVRRGALDLLPIDPRCNGLCEIRLEYEGGWEYKLCRMLSALTMIALIGVAAGSRHRAVL